MLLSPIYGGFSKKGLEANKNVGKTVDMLASIYFLPQNSVGSFTRIFFQLALEDYFALGLLCELLWQHVLNYRQVER